MEYIQLGINGPLVSQIGLGSMMMGWRTNCSQTQKIISKAYDLGINFIDTSISYSRGLSHDYISKAFKNLKLRDNFFIATKVGGVSNNSDLPEHRGLTKENIIRQCELSLRQLNTDQIDLLQLHFPLENNIYYELLEALSTLINQGKIKYFGLCNYTEKDIDLIFHEAITNNFPFPISSQFEFNILTYNSTHQYFNHAKLKKMGTITWGSLSGGIISDWYANNSQIKPQSRIYYSREKYQKEKLLGRLSTQEILFFIKKISLDYGISLEEIALSWILLNQKNNCTLVGPSKEMQLDIATKCISKKSFEAVTKLNSFLGIN